MNMRKVLFWLLAIITTIHAFALPTSLESFTEASQSLFKRKGGGGGGKGGGSGSSSGGSSSGSSSGSSGSGRGSTSSNSGGSTRTGSGSPKVAAGSYAGGASTPYTSGTFRGVQPYLLGGAALAFFPGVWLYGAYAYNYGHPWTYHNNTSNTNDTLPVQCLCAQYQECGCDDNNSTDYQNSVANNASLSRVATVNGTQTLFINGTLDNGTTTDGGDEDAYSAASALPKTLVEMSGFWVVIAGVAYTLWLM